MRDTTIVDIKPPKCSRCIPHEDKFQFLDLAQSHKLDPADLQQLQVDPEGILTPEEREIFHTLHKRFAPLFKKQTGKYNAHFGYIDNKLQFSATPRRTQRPEFQIIHPQ